MEYVLSDIFFFHFILLAMWWMSRINPVWLDKIYCILQVIGQYLAFISHTPSVFIVQAGKLRIQRLNDCARNYLFMIHQMNVWSTVDCHNYLFYFQWRCDMYALFLHQYEIQGMSSPRSTCGVYLHLNCPSILFREHQLLPIVWCFRFNWPTVDTSFGL